MIHKSTSPIVQQRSIADGLRDGSGSSRRSRDYKRTARTQMNRELQMTAPYFLLYPMNIPVTGSKLFPLLL